MADPCKRCGLSAFWCCTPADDDGPPWITLEFYDAPLTAFRVIDEDGTRWAEVREYDHDTGAHQTVTISAADIAMIATALASTDMRPRDSLFCGFCLKKQREVKLLMAGRLAYICDDCARGVHEFLIEHEAKVPHGE